MKIIFTGLILLISYTNGFSQLLAFPTAEGAGKNTSGGRGTSLLAPTVYVVNTLTDNSSSATTPGTLRYAATHSGPTYRIIVFRVSGTIHLYAKLQFTRPNTTVAGQTAPGQGICLADYPVQVNANNVIVRYMRFRMGDYNENPTGTYVVGTGGDDAFDDASNSHNHIIIDHCTMSWSNDEACSFYSGDSLTLQWNMFSEPLNYSYHLESGDGTTYEHHGYGGIQGGMHATFHHNAYVHCQGRAPRFDGSRNLGGGSTPGLENVDFVNNVIYDWGIYNTNGGEGGNYNVVNNYYKYGPSTSTGTTKGVAIKSMIINPYETSPLPYGKYYLTGNYQDNSATITNDNWLGAAMNSGSLADTPLAKVTVPFVIVPINMQTVTDGYQSVLSSAGCSLPGRDTLDQRIVGNIFNRTGHTIDRQGDNPAHPGMVGSTAGNPALYPTPTAWPTLDGGFTPVDTDGDGMPDIWETQRGLNPNSITDLNGYISTSGYNNIENFLNGDTLTAPGVLNTCITGKTINSINSGNWVFMNDSSYSAYNSPSYLASTDSNNVIAAILDNGNFGSFTASYYTTGILRNDAFGHPYLNRNITITPANPALITSPVTVRIYISKTEFNALKAADASINTISDLRLIKISGSACLTSLSGGGEVIVPSATGVFGTYSTGYYLQFTTSSFSTFFVTSAASAIALPLNLVSFKASLNNGQVICNWITENEVNTSHFEVERSVDGQTFNYTGSVIALNNRSSVNTYSFNDISPVTGISYYRLKIVDIDGHYKYSPVVLINNSRNALLKVFPDPVQNSLGLIYKSTGSEAIVKIIAADGRLMLQKPVNGGSTQANFDVSQLHPGVYELLFIDGSMVQKAKFVKE